MSIKVLLADDSPLVRQVLADMLHQTPDIVVIGCACNGQEAAAMTLTLQPDLVVMDLMMPVMNGIDSIEEIMSGTPTPVLVLSGAVDSTEMDCAFNAIKRGALDVMEKPALHSPEAMEAFAARLIDKVRLLSGIRVIRHPRRKQRPAAPDPIPMQGPTPNLLAIGASTGGPRAVMTLLKSLPKGFPAAVFVVQHIAEGFAEGFATWLNRECALPVRLAVDGAAFGPAEALVAPDGSHMTVCDGRIRLLDQAPVNCCRPSIDVFFSSLAQQPCDRVVSLLLTGMGKDGAQGLLRIKERGGMTLVQDEVSCAVFGMPKAAINLEAARQVLPLDRMPAAILKLFAGS